MNSISCYIPWHQLKNPVYSHAGWSVKDACMIEKDGVFFVFFSAFYWEDEQERSHVVEVKTTDWLNWSEPIINWRGQEGGWIGLCSPNITEAEGEYYLTFNSWGDKAGQPNQLFYARSNDLEHWETVQPLASSLTMGTRSIDAAVIYHQNQFYLVWKKVQISQIAVSPTIDGDWQHLGQAADFWFENAHFIEIDGSMQMVLTSRDQQHRTSIAPMAGDSRSLANWTRWLAFRAFDIPPEAFNLHEQANAGFLADWRRQDGYYYLIYAGTTEGVSHARRGDNRLGLARSRDLIRWEVPPGL